MKKINILGVNVVNAKKSEILDKIKQYLDSNNKYFLITPNAEIILESLKDKELFDILNKADLSIADTITLKYASWVLGQNITRFPGADLVREILKIAEKQGKKSMVFNLSKGLSDKKDIEKAIKTEYPRLDCLVEDVYNYEKYVMGKKAEEFKPEVVFVTFGGGRQEKFIYKKIIAANIINPKISIGIGGAFDFITGKTKRAPKIMRILGFEWLWRLVLRPNWSKKLGRIWRAVIVFPVRFAFWRFFGRR